MKDEHSSSPYLRKTISDPHLSFMIDISRLPYFHHEYDTSTALLTGISCLPLGPHVCRTCTLARQLSLGGTMIRGSHRSPEG